MLILIGLVLVFPILDFFRYYDPDTGLENIVLSFEWINAGHFDSFQNFASLVYLDLVLMPEQWLGVLLFFVPRALWPEKPIHSGAVIANEEMLSMENIAMNLIGEGFIFGGVLGVIILAIIFGLFTGWCDRRIRGITLLDSKFCVVYVLLCTTVFFFFRGSLMSAYAYLFGACVLAVFFLYLARVTFRNHSIKSPK